MGHEFIFKFSNLGAPQPYNLMGGGKGLPNGSIWSWKLVMEFLGKL